MNKLADFLDDYCAVLGCIALTCLAFLGLAIAVTFF